jgi:hypothetical protein
VCQERRRGDLGDHDRIRAIATGEPRSDELE